MKNKQIILILGRREYREGYESPELFKKYLPSIMPEHELVFGHFDELDFYCAPEETHIYLQDRDLSDFDKVFLFGWYKDWKDIAYATAVYLHWHKIPILNTEALHQRSSGKVSQAVIFGLNGLSIPRTFFGTEGDISNKAVEWVGGLPMIVKQYNGNKGKNNHLVNSLGELDDLYSIDSGVKFIIQEYIPNDGDMRVIFANGDVQLILKRQAVDKNTHLHNISKGAKGSYLDTNYLDDSIKKDIAASASLLHRELSGLDIVLSKTNNTFYILESNNLPQIASWAYRDKHLTALADAIKNL